MSKFQSFYFAKTLQTSYKEIDHNVFEFISCSKRFESCYIKRIDTKVPYDETWNVLCQHSCVIAARGTTCFLTFFLCFGASRDEQALNVTLKFAVQKSFRQKFVMTPSAAATMKPTATNATTLSLRNAQRWKSYWNNLCSNELLKVMYSFLNQFFEIQNEPFAKNNVL